MLDSAGPVPLPRDALETLSPGTCSFDASKLEALHASLASDVQSNILLGNGSLHARLLFLRFAPDRFASARLLADLIEGISCTGADQTFRLCISRFGSERDAEGSGAESKLRAPLLNLLLSSAGYRALGADPAALGDPAFTAGTRAARALDRLLDPPPLDWEPAYREPWHALIVLSHDDSDVLGSALAAVIACATRRNALALRRSSSPGAASQAPEPDVHVESANMLGRDGKLSTSHDASFEIFGFRDGISQPVFLEHHWQEVRAKQYVGAEPKPGADPRSPLSLVLARDPWGTRFCEAEAPGVRYGLGSFFVFRKLEQDYHGFEVRTQMYRADVRHRRDFLEALYDSKHASTPGAARSAHANPYSRDKTEDDEQFVLRSLIGRDRGGVPNQQRGSATGSELFNDFDYAEDREGAVCPFSAHIRKANPRGATGDLTQERRRRIARRGLPYGTRESRAKHQLKADAGLLFLCAQADIAEQFEHIQAIWLNGRSEPGALPHPALDALMGQLEPKGQGEARSRPYASAYGRRPGSAVAVRADEQQARGPRHGWINQTVRMEFDFQDYVELKGAEYLFAPSLSGLRQLISDITEQAAVGGAKP